MTASAKTLRTQFPSGHPIQISKRAWYYESRESILLVAEYDAPYIGAVQVRIPLRKLEQFCKRAQAAALKRKRTGRR